MTDRKPNGHWTANDCENARLEAAEHPNRSSLYRSSYSAYITLRKRGLLEQVFGKRQQVGCTTADGRKPNGFWRNNDCKEARKEAKKHSIRHSLFRSTPAAYQALKDNGLLDEIFPKGKT